MFAIAAIPMIVALGTAVDYVRGSNDRTQLQVAIDAATLAAANNYSSSRDQTAAIADGKKNFATNCTRPVCQKIGDPVFQFNEDGSIAGTINSKLDTAFLKFAGMTSIDVTAGAVVRPGSKIEQFHFAIDMSASMGIASGAANQQALMDLTKPYVGNHRPSMSPDGCAFACHMSDGWEPAGTNSYQMARDAGIELREDVLIDNVNIALDTILSRITGTHADQVKVAAYGFSEDLVTITKPTANSTNIKTKIDKLNITRRSTRFDIIMPKLVTAVGVSGSGTDRKDPAKTLVLLTDGVQMNYDTIHSQLFNSNDCDALKSNGVRVVVINIQYQELTGNAVFEYMVRPFYKNLTPELQDCASPGFYYEAGDTPQIQAQLVKMVKDLDSATMYIAE